MMEVWAVLGVIFFCNVVEYTYLCLLLLTGLEVGLFHGKCPDPRQPFVCTGLRRYDSFAV
jgi:hypothetical protein